LPTREESHNGKAHCNPVTLYSSNYTYSRGYKMRTGFISTNSLLPHPALGSALQASSPKEITVIYQLIEAFKIPNKAQVRSFISITAQQGLKHGKPQPSSYANH
jgi:hypothetical protein